MIEAKQAGFASTTYLGQLKEAVQEIVNAQTEEEAISRLAHLLDAFAQFGFTALVIGEQLANLVEKGELSDVNRRQVMDAIELGLERGYFQKEDSAGDTD